MEGFLVDALAQRTIIIGNSGSGKSTLAARLASATAVPLIGLDEIYWVDQRLLKKRGQLEAVEMARTLAASSTWVMDGVFGWLVENIAPRATSMIWLDLPWADCKAGLLTRGPVHGADEAEFNDLLAWAHLYWERRTSSSHVAHEKIFVGFGGPKLRLRTRAEVKAFSGQLAVASVA